MTYKVLVKSSNRVIFRSRIKLSSVEPNKRIGCEDTELRLRNPKNGTKTRSMAIIDPTDLIGKSYYADYDENGHCELMDVIEKDGNIKEDTPPELTNFRSMNQDSNYEDIIS